MPDLLSPVFVTYFDMNMKSVKGYGDISALNVDQVVDSLPLLSILKVRLGTRGSNRDDLHAVISGNDFVAVYGDQVIPMLSLILFVPSVSNSKVKVVKGDIKVWYGCDGCGDINIEFPADVSRKSKEKIQNVLGFMKNDIDRVRFYHNGRYIDIETPFNVYVLREIVDNLSPCDFVVLQVYRHFYVIYSNLDC